MGVCGVKGEECDMRVCVCGVRGEECGVRGGGVV